MAEIQLLNNKGVTIVDDGDFNFLSQFKWRRITVKSTHTYDYVIGCVELLGKKFYDVPMHRLIALAQDFGDRKIKVIHLDHNGLNNQRLNLKKADPSGVCAYRRMQVNNTSGYRGVHRRADDSGWEAQVTYGGKKIYLGTFNTSKEAAIVYDNVVPSFFGELAVLNFPKQAILAPADERSA